MTKPYGRLMVPSISAVVLAVLYAGHPHPEAAALNDGPALNGTYTVVSDGQWAKTNERFEPQGTVTSTWTITSSCRTYQDCSGRVVSDHGWSADLRYVSGVWSAAFDVPDWMRCADGTVVPGAKTFTFWRPRGDHDDSLLRGRDETVGPSGACGVNKWLTITMPLTVTKTA